MDKRREAERSTEREKERERERGQRSRTREEVTVLLTAVYGWAIILLEEKIVLCAAFTFYRPQKSSHQL